VSPAKPKITSLPLPTSPATPSAPALLIRRTPLWMEVTPVYVFALLRVRTALVAPVRLNPVVPLMIELMVWVVVAVEVRRGEPLAEAPWPQQPRALPSPRREGFGWTGDGDCGNRWTCSRCSPAPEGALGLSYVVAISRLETVGKRSGRTRSDSPALTATDLNV